MGVRQTIGGGGCSGEKGQRLTQRKTDKLGERPNWLTGSSRKKSKRNRQFSGIGTANSYEKKQPREARGCWGGGGA